MGELQYHIRCKPGDVGEVVLLPGDPGRVEPIARLLERPRLIARNREFTTYTGELAGRMVSVCSTGIGSPSTAIAVEELAAIGVVVIDTPEGQRWRAGPARPAPRGGARSAS